MKQVGYLMMILGIPVIAAVLVASRISNSLLVPVVLAQGSGCSEATLSSLPGIHPTGAFGVAWPARGRVSTPGCRRCCEVRR